MEQIQTNQRNHEIIDFCKDKGVSGYYAGLIGELLVADEYHQNRIYQKEGFKLRSIFDRLPKRITEVFNTKDGEEY